MCVIKFGYAPAPVEAEPFAKPLLLIWQVLSYTVSDKWPVQIEHETKYIQDQAHDKHAWVGYFYRFLKWETSILPY